MLDCTLAVQQHQQDTAGAHNKTAATSSCCAAPAAAATMAGQIEAWFRLADTDRDGAIGGAEAVAFFTRSGLPQDVLGQVWAAGMQDR